MQSNVPFQASEDGLYKIVSALDQTKCFTIQQSRLVLDNYKGVNGQKFNIFSNQGKFAIVSTEGNVAVMVAQDSTQDGANVQVDPGQHKSSFFELLTVTSGPFAGKGFYLKTFCSKSLDVYEGRTSPGTPVIQWSYHGNNNQIWLAYPCDSNSQQQPQQPQQQFSNKSTFPQVPANFVPANTTYKILSVLNTSKALTVSNDKTIKISDYIGDPSQKFNIYQEGGKLALVVTSFQEGLCVAKDSADNGAKVLADSGKHPSSWFQLTRASVGEWQNRAYKIKTCSRKVLDLAEGRIDNGTPIVQWSEHNDFNQVWLLVPSDQPVAKHESKSQGASLFGINLPNMPLPNIPNFNFPKFG